MTHKHDLGFSEDEQFEYISCFSCPKVWKRQRTDEVKGI